jgi:hypothetical protein
VCGALGALNGCSSNKSDSSVSSAGSGGSAGSAGTFTMLMDAGNPDGSGASSGTGSSGGGNQPDKCASFVGLDGGTCAATTEQANYSTANIMLVIDKSGSMADTPSGFGVDKWHALQQALSASLNNVQGSMNFGLILYPYNKTSPISLNCTSGCCNLDPGEAAVNVPVAPGATSVSQILGALSATSPGGGTPTAAALKVAYDYYTTGAGASLQGDKYVLLATDGGPNCNGAITCDAQHCTPNLDGQCTGTTNCCSSDHTFCLDDQGVISQIAQLKTAGISTFVVGIPGTEQYAQYLDQFAQAGGVPNANAPPSYYDVPASGGVMGLANTFTSITTHLVRSCDVELGTVPQNLDLVNVAVDCQLVPYQDGAGWTLVSDASGNSSTVTVKGDACTYIQTSGARRVDVVYGCPILR